MIKRFIILFSSIIMTIFLGGCSEKGDGQLSQKEKIEDFNYMYEVIKEAHPFFRGKQES